MNTDATTPATPVGDRWVASNDPADQPRTSPVDGPRRVMAGAAMVAVWLLGGACSQPAGDTSTPFSPAASTTGEDVTSDMSQSTPPSSVVPRSGDDGSTSPPVSPSPVPSVEAAPSLSPSAQPGLVETLCQARQVAVDGGGVAEVFARAHDGLHQVARDLEEAGERVVAGDLLEAKQRVEAVVDDEPPPGDLPDRLADLVDATAQGLTTLGDRPDSCD